MTGRGFTGILSNNHLAILQIEKSTGAQFATVQFDGGAPNLTALLGGHIDVAFGAVGDFASQLKSGQGRVIGVMDQQRSKFFTDLKTFEEQGYKLYAVNSRAFSVPAGTSAEIVKLLEVGIQRAMANADVVKKLDEMALEERFMGSAELTKYWQDRETQTSELMRLVR